MESMLISDMNQKSARSAIIGVDKNFSCGPYLCDGFYNMTKKCNERKNIAIICIKKLYTEFVFCL